MRRLNLELRYVSSRLFHAITTGEPFTDNGPEKRAAVAVKNGGKCLEAMVIALDGKDTTFI